MVKKDWRRKGKRRYVFEFEEPLAEKFEAVRAETFLGAPVSDAFIFRLLANHVVENPTFLRSLLLNQTGKK
jgi:hypothetical protein